MTIDDKWIGWEWYTIIANKTWKIAVMIQSTKSAVIQDVLSKVPASVLFWVKTITADLAENYDWVCRTMFKRAVKIADKFHVIKLWIEALQNIRIRYRQKAIDDERIRYEEFRSSEAERRNELKQQGKLFHKACFPNAKTYINGETKKQLLARSRYLLFQFKTKWSEYQSERAEILFEEFPEIKQAYQIITSFRTIYNIIDTENIDVSKKFETWRKNAVDSWITEIISFASTYERHKYEILPYFKYRQTNAFAESLNAKIQRFVISNYWIRNRDFFHFRIKQFLS